MRTFFAYTGVTLALTLVGYLWWSADGQYRFDRSHSTVIAKMKELGFMVGASQKGSKIVPGGRDTEGWINYYFFSDRILLAADGEVFAGVDLTKLRQEDIHVDGTSVILTLPPTRILTHRLDNTTTKVHSRDTAILAGDNLDLEAKTRQTAEAEIVADICASGLLDAAATGVRNKLTDILKKFRFETIQVNVVAGPCTLPPLPAP
jgi:hypothetical protein